jgi:hypothetical integral membrane protein (TIGR02206 family)
MIMDILSKRPEMIDPFKLFGWAHLITLALMIFIGIFIISKSLSNKKFSKYAKFFIIVNLMLMDLSYRLWSGFYQTNNISGLLSIHISSMSVILSVIVLIRFKQKIFDVLFYWALILVPQAIITPGIYRFGFPHLRFFQILWVHFLVLYTIVYLLWVEKRRLSKNNLRRALIVTHIYGFFVFIVNMIFNTNYMFIGNKSSVPSLIQYLGPWPYYIFVLDIILIVLFIVLNKIYRKVIKNTNYTRMG